MPQQDPSAIEKIKRERHANGQPVYNLNQPIEQSFELRPDKKVEPAQFRPSKIVSGIFYAHPQTIRALKKDIFTSCNPDDLVEEVQCQSCSRTHDAQFWLFCPHCGGNFQPLPTI